MAQPINMDLETYVEKMKGLGLCKEKKNDWAVLCPNCYEEHRAKGEMNYRSLKLWVDKDLKYSHCFRCGTVYISDDGSLDTRVRSIEDPVDFNNFKVVKIENDPYFTIDRFYTFSEYDEIGVNYLASRVYLYREMYKYLKIRFDSDHNPVTPFFINDELVYYQIRIIDKSSDKKYHNPIISHKTPYILKSSNPITHVYICEGTFDAIALRLLYPDATSFAVLGSDITTYQIAILRTMVPDKITIFMDKTEISLRIKDSIQKYINYCEIEIHKSNGQDPEEYLKEKIVNDMLFENL